MKLLTKEILKKFPAIGDTGDKDAADVPIIAKFFIASSSATWYATEYNPDTNEMFGFAEILPGCGELGYFNFNEIKDLRGKFGLGLERDLYFNATLREVIDGTKR